MTSPEREQIAVRLPPNLLERLNRAVEAVGDGEPYSRNRAITVAIEDWVSWVETGE